VKGVCERFDLSLQTLHQFAARAHGNAWDIVNGFVGVQLNTLAAHMGQGIHNVAANVLQAELKSLKQAHWACAHDDGIGVDRGCRHGAGALMRGS
jgi:hypothetical protein